VNDTSPTIRSAAGDAWLITLIWIAIMGAALLLRPLLPIDETRYVTVAWEMWTGDNFLIPHLNGEIYTHKPPLLFWLIKLGWLAFGVSETWARLVAPAFGLAALWLTYKLAHELWPEARADQLATRALTAPLLMVSGLYWTVFSTMTMFDMMLTAATLVAVLGFVKAWKGFVSGRGFWTGMLLAGVGMGLGGLAKGPAVLVHTLPVALSAPLWGPALVSRDAAGGWGKWYAGVLASVVAGLAVAALWVVPAVIEGGPAYRDAILIKQSAGRMTQSFAHRRPFFWFVWVLPLMLLPWTLWPRLWRGVGFVAAWREKRGLRATWDDGAVRLLLIWAGASFVIFSAISGKQPHYLLPVFPALTLFAGVLLTRPGSGDAHPKGRGHLVPALLLCFVSAVLLGGLLARGLIEPMLKKPLPDWVGAAEPLWLVPALILAVAAAWMKCRDPRAEARLIAVTVASVIMFVHMAAAPAFTLAYDLEPSAKAVKAYQDAGRPVAYVGKYHGEFQFLGRLTRPVVELNNFEDGQAWAREHPEGVVIATVRPEDIPQDRPPLEARPYRGKVMAMWNAADF